MRSLAWAVLAVLALPLPAAGGALEDLDGAAAYLAEGSGGALSSASGAPAWGPDLAPAAGHASGRAPGSFEQGRALRPAGLAMTWWAGDAAAAGDAQQLAAEHDSVAFLGAWLAYLPLNPGPPGLGLPRPLDRARHLAQGYVAVATDPAVGTITDADALTLHATIQPPSGGRVREAWAHLGGPGIHHLLALQRAEDGAWSAPVPGLLPPGAYTLWVEALDDALSAPSAAPALVRGLWFLGAGRSEPLDFGVRDATPPRLALRGPAVTNLSAITIHVAARDASGVEALRADAGAGFGDWQAPVPALVVPLPADGATTVVVEARDDAGHVARAEHRVLRDTQAPAALLDAPGEGWRREPVAVQARAGRSLSAAQVALTLDGSDPRAAPFLDRAELRFEGPGVAEVRAVARDAAGNVGPEATRTLRVDAVPPRLALLAEPAPPLVAPLRLALDASDAHSGLASVEAALVDAAGVARPVDPQGFDVPAGAWTLRARAADVAGNAATLEFPFAVTPEAIPGAGFAPAPPPAPPAPVEAPVAPRPTAPVQTAPPAPAAPIPSPPPPPAAAAPPAPPPQPAPETEAVPVEPAPPAPRSVPSPALVLGLGTIGLVALLLRRRP